jgi:periplasmic protein TonB
VEMVVPAVLLSEMVAPPAPQTEAPAPLPQPAPPEPVKKAAEPKKPAPAPQATPRPVARADAPPSPQAPTGVAEAQPAAAPVAAPQPAAAPVAAVPAVQKIELPSSDANYLQNPRPHYPPMSERLNEQGRVVVDVLITADGRPQDPRVKVSSGFDRLDRAAIEHVMRCRFVPGKVNGVPTAMRYDAPVKYEL